MSVYVDGMQAEFGNMIMCHMIADSHDELIRMVDLIGVQRKWIQWPGHYREHFDICLSKRNLAVHAGAIVVSSKDLVRKMMAKRK